ncbi:hypothetical protein GGTG_04003 [Gaeumannomyces tritici R3-111a-1]|uniref:Uncharacterized protein n=1 Tax=Gaeumannomyces tritici (strain R3-111a-1) TaxID=644352 RepID=J3NRV4_GAET3|nr:hypothetical protein GGTG_04003 [Gaeumannomyces tritici R3-111a-1]EJT78910.1 hypothetical protein GGTG_04003 [Gaeumannomyces tritici R3-111a-1]
MLFIWYKPDFFLHGQNFGGYRYPQIFFKRLAGQKGAFYAFIPEIKGINDFVDVKVVVQGYCLYLFVLVRSTGETARQKAGSVKCTGETARQKRRKGALAASRARTPRGYAGELPGFSVNEISFSFLRVFSKVKYYNFVRFKIEISYNCYYNFKAFGCKRNNVSFFQTVRLLITFNYRAGFIICNVTVFVEFIGYYALIFSLRQLQLFPTFLIFGLETLNAIVKPALKKKALGESKRPVLLRGWLLPLLTGGKREGGAFCSFGFALDKPLKALNAFGIAIGGAAKVPFVVAIGISGFGHLKLGICFSGWKSPSALAIPFWVASGFFVSLYLTNKLLGNLLNIQPRISFAPVSVNAVPIRF